MKLGLTFPAFHDDFERKPETRAARVATWLEHAAHRDAPTAARLIGDALAALNRLDMSEVASLGADRAILEDGASRCGRR
jgi:hypothetical protein